MEHPSSNTIEVNLGLYEAQLRGEIASDLTTLQITYDAITDPNYINKKYILNQKFTIAEISVPPVEFLKRREINKCFKSIIGSLQDYMDKLISILRLKSEGINISQPLSFEDLNGILVKKFEEHLLKVSVDRSLNVPKKLDILLDKPEHQVYRETIQSYFDLRNGLEHHKGIAKTDRIVRYKRLGVVSSAGYEVIMETPLGVGGSLVMRTFDEEIKYDMGGTLLLERDQLDSIILNLLIFVIPTIQTVTGDKFNSRN